MKTNTSSKQMQQKHSLHSNVSELKEELSRDSPQSGHAKIWMNFFSPPFCTQPKPKESDFLVSSDETPKGTLAELANQKGSVLLLASASTSVSFTQH